MPSVSFPKEWRLLSAPSFGIATSDVKLHCWTRRRALNALPVFGGQTLFGIADDARWVNSRALRPHLGKLFEGARCAPSPLAPPVTSVCALNLRVVEETGGALPDGTGALPDGTTDERAMVPANVALRVRWESSETLDFTAATGGEGESGASPGGGWGWRALDGPTGTVITAGISREPLSGATFEALIPAAALGNAGRCLLFHVAATGVSKPLAWPGDYQIVTGESQFKPAKYLWLHPTLGLLPFDPRYRVGALPYDRSDPVQEALLEETERLEAAGALLLREEWADKLITFNADGSPVTAGGEFSCLKIQSAAGWCGDGSVSLAACAGACLWTGDEAGVLTARVVEPRLRRVGALLEEPDGTFWIAGDVATRNGLRTALLKLDGAWSISLAAYGDPFESSGAGIEVTPQHSRALLCARCGFNISRGLNGAMHVLTFAGQMRLSIKRGKVRLVRVGEGGRSGASLERLDGTQIGARVLDPDRARTDAFALFAAPRGAGHVLFDASPYPGPAVAKSYSSALCAKETFWVVVASLGKESLGASPKSPDSQLASEYGDDQQGLARFTLGGLEVVKWWRASQWDMGRVVPWARGVYAFGFGEDGKPRAHRWSGDGDGLIEMGLSLPFLVLWGACGLVPDGETETLRIVGKKFFGNRELPGWYAAEGTYGPRGAGGISAGGGANVTDFGWNAVLGAFTISRADLEAAGFDAQAFPPFLQWNEEGAAWLACASAPVQLPLQPAATEGWAWDDAQNAFVSPPGTTDAAVLSLAPYLRWRVAEGSPERWVVTRAPPSDAPCLRLEKSALGRWLYARLDPAPSGILLTDESGVLLTPDGQELLLIDEPNRAPNDPTSGARLTDENGRALTTDSGEPLTW